MGRKVKLLPTGTAMGTVQTTVLGHIETIEVEIGYTVSNSGCAAQTYGPPENCYPAEGIEVDLDETFQATLGEYTFTGRTSECRDWEHEQLMTLAEQDAYENRDEDPLQYEREDA